ncbi:hypothetical protein B0O79_1857 [Flavobacteriaceae bacterium MAR_2009_75]|nr:hypothetical protein B0O79_1857 [Flavobacteriaceae bacterium MAR_2009_75]
MFILILPKSMLLGSNIILMLGDFSENAVIKTPSLYGYELLKNHFRKEDDLSGFSKKIISRKGLIPINPKLPKFYETPHCFRIHLEIIEIAGHKQRWAP